MSIEWNKVTWYSKLIALVLFVALPFIGFSFGVKYQKMRDIGYEGRRIIQQDQALTTNYQSLTTSTAGWKTYRNEKYGFEFMYPNYLQVDRSDRSGVSLEKIGTDGYRLEIFTGPKSPNLSLEQWIFPNAFGFTEPGEPSTFAAYTRAEVESIAIGCLSGLKVTRTSLQTEIAIFLDDSKNQRVFWFRIFGTNADQDLYLQDNIPEIMSIIESFRRLW